MNTHRRPGERAFVRRANGLGLVVVVSLILPGTRALAADPVVPEQGTPAPAAAPSEPLDLAACLNLALERQPRIAAARASLAAAEDGKRGLDSLHVAGVVDAQIPIRRRQACLGISAAGAALDQAEHETVYAVTRTYFTVLYAREQERVARGVVERLGAINDVARGAVQSGARNVTSNDVNRTTVYLRLAQAQQHKAAVGVKRALVALQEAIGVGPDCHIDVPAGKLPQLDLQLNLDDIVCKALSRRGEMAQASLFAQTACLEVEAQGTGIHKRMETFAAGADIHSRPVPLGEHNEDYRPGGVLPEYPDLLVGCRPERVQHARDLHVRAGAVTDVTRNLIALEAQDAYHRWEEATLQVTAAKEAIDSGESLADDLSKDLTSGLKAKVEDVVNARVLAAQARSRYNEYLYRQILAVADIERITAGGVCGGLAELSVPRGQPAAENGNAGK
jgi:outer membrane protein TolC